MPFALKAQKSVHSVLNFKSREISREKSNSINNTFARVYTQSRIFFSEEEGGKAKLTIIHKEWSASGRKLTS